MNCQKFHRGLLVFFVTFSIGIAGVCMVLRMSDTTESEKLCDRANRNLELQPDKLLTGKTEKFQNPDLGLKNCRQITKQKKIQSFVEGGVLNMKAIYLQKPKFPEKVKYSGGDCLRVNVQVLLDEEGRLISSKAIFGNPALQKAAEDAAKKTVFKPTFLGGEPMNVSGILVYDFVPNE